MHATYVGVHYVSGVILGGAGRKWSNGGVSAVLGCVFVSAFVYDLVKLFCLILRYWWIDGGRAEAGGLVIFIHDGARRHDRKYLLSCGQG